MIRVIATLLVAFLPSAVTAQQATDAVIVNTAETAFSIPTPGAAPGTSVDVNVKTTFSAQPTGSNVSIFGSSTLDLSDLQRKLPAIVAKFDLPHDNCQRFAGDNLVASPQIGGLVLANGTATLSISGVSSVWACLQSVVPESKVVWSLQQVAPGLKTKVPTVVTSVGAPIKSKLMDAQFEWAAPLVWTRSGQLRTTDGTITFKDADAAQNLRDGRNAQWLAPLNASLTDQVNKMIGPLLDANKIVPSEFADKHPIVQSVEWIDEDGHLAAMVKWGATIPADQKTPKNP